VRFWDSSALVTLLLEQPRSAHARTLAAEDGEMMVWWGSAVECASAIARLHRDGQLSATDERVARAMLAELSTAWYEMQPGTAVRDQAMRVLRVHPLRAADALQLAAALEWSGGAASGMFISYDERLRDAASREGFTTP
jgi:predicted nucleic acid-binding protein